MLKKELTSGISIKEIAEIVAGNVIGNQNIKVFSLCPLEHLEEGSLSFIKTTGSGTLARIISDSRIAGLLLPKQADLNGITCENCALIVVDDPVKAVVQLVPYFFERYHPTPTISEKAEIDPSAQIGARVSIGAFTVISQHVVIGDDAVIHPNVTIYPYAVIGKRAVIHSNAVIREACILEADTIIQNGAVIGADGFGYFLDPDVGLRAVPQVGNTILSKKVEVGANSCVDRATLGSTSVGLNTKIDNLVQIGHNTEIGSNSIICGMVGISGSAKIGNQVTLAGNVGVADHITIGDGIRVGARAGVSQSIDKKGDYAGYPAIPIRDWLRQVASLARLPALMAEIKKMTKN